MRRTRRAAAPDVAPEETAEQAASETAMNGQAAPEPSSTETTAATPDTPPKPRRRRTSRPQTEESAGETPTPVAAASVELPDTEAPVEPAGETTLAPVKRGGRRRKATEPAEVPPPAAEGAAPLPDMEAPTAPAADTPPMRRRGRRKETVPTPISLDAVAEGTPPEEVAPTQPLDVVESVQEATSIPAEPVRKRPGGRRTRTAQAAPVAEVSEVEAPVVEAPTADTPVPARRRRRRRGEPLTPTAETPETATETDIEPLDNPAAEEVAAEGEESAKGEEGERRGRRSRRSRRRRGAEVEVPLDLGDAGDTGLILPELVPVDETPEEDEDEGLALIAPAPPVYVAPLLVPPVLAPADGAPLPRVRAAIQRPSQGGGLPQIVVEDQAHSPFFFFINAEAALSGEVVDSQIHQAASAGIHLYSSVLYLPLKNAYGDRSFGATDALLQQILAADPDAYILPRLQFVPTNYWARTHPDQMARYADGSEGDVSLASTEFWADCVDALEALIVHLADPETPGGDRVIGFHLDRGEWFYDQASGYDYSEPNRVAFQNWLHAKYQFPYALRAAWFNGSVTFDDAEIPVWPGAALKPGDAPLYSGPRDGRWPDFALFASDLVAQAITGLADAIKTLSDGRLLVGVSYGYTLEFATRNDSGHLSLARVLDSPSIDILAGPNSYSGRGAGSAGAFGAPIDSVALHGKLWLVEDDTKTFLAEEETPDTYNPKIASGADTRAAHERHFGAALAHRAGVTWMDLWGQGWLDNQDIWRELGRLRDQADRLGRITPAPALTPDVAVFVDEASLAYFRNSPTGLGQTLIGKSRDLLLRSGASVGFYLQSDVLSENLPDAKLYLFLNALRVTNAERKAIRERLHRPGKTVAWLYAPGLFDEQGLAEQEIGDTVGMALRLQPWNARLGSQLTEAKSPITDRLRSGKRGVGQDEVLNPSFTVVDPQATILAEYVSTGAPSLAVREHPTGWKSVFFGDPHLTNELLRGLYAYAGVSVYESQDDVLYAGEGVLLIHAPYTGQRSLTLPRRAAVYDVAEDRIIASDTRTFRAFLRARTTRLFLWGDADAIAAVTELTLPSPVADATEPAQELPVEITTTTPGPRSPSSVLNEILFQSEAELLREPSVESGSEEAYPEESDLVGGDLSGSLDPLEDAALPTLDDEPGAEGTDEANGAEPAASARRSRWQRRRAAMRARREAERQARTAEGAPDRGNAANPPIDIASILPDLPPRRKSQETTPEISEGPE